MSKKYFYKVLTNGGSYVPLLSKRVRINYLRKGFGKWIYPKVKGTKIYVFKDLEQARRLRSWYVSNGRDRKKIIKCEASNPKLCRTILEWSYLDIEELRGKRNLQDYISGLFTNPYHFAGDVQKHYPGTYEVEVVKMIEEVNI